MSARDQADRIRGTWTGRIEFAPGEESKVFVEVANSSAADVRLYGEFVDVPSARR